MNVCLVYQDQYPWDIRIEKFCKTLSKCEYNVYLVSRNRTGLPGFEEISPGFYVARLRYYRNKLINFLCNFPAFFSIFWILKIFTVCKHNKCSLIIVRDIPLFVSGFIVAKILKIPVCLDMAENYPEMISDTWKYGKVKWYDIFVRNPYLLKILEKFSIFSADRILVVSSESRDRLISLGVNQNVIRIVGNTPELNDKFVRLECDDVVRSLSNFNILYVGGLEESRGLDTVIKSMPILKRLINNFKFIIAGSGSSCDYLNKLASDLGVSENVCFLGWVDPESVPSLINSCDVCVVPHYVTNHIDTTMPNKIYDYMACGKPVLVSNARSLENLVKREKCGLVFIDKNIDSFVEQCALLIDSSTRALMGDNGRRAVFERHNWDVDSKVLLDSLVDIND